MLTSLHDCESQHTVLRVTAVEMCDEYAPKPRRCLNAVQLNGILLSVQVLG